MAAPSTGPQWTVDVRPLRATLKALRTEMGDNGRFYRRTLKAVKKAAGQAVTRADHYLPAQDEVPSGFSAFKPNGDPWIFQRLNRNNNNNNRPYPHYDYERARASIKVTTRKGKAKRLQSGEWRGGQISDIGIEMKDPAGSMFDVAGHKYPMGKRRTFAGAWLLGGFTRASKVGALKFRVLLPAVIDTREGILRDIRKALDSAELALRNIRYNPWED